MGGGLYWRTKEASRCGRRVGAGQAGQLAPHPHPAAWPGGVQTSLTLPATLAAACFPGMTSLGGQVMGRREAGAEWEP